MALTKVPSNLDATISVTQSASDNSTNIATTAYVTTAIANLVDSSPSALNTLNELAAALGDDANFSTTVTNSLGTKLNLSGGTLTGGLGISYTNPILSLTTPWSTGNYGQIRLGYTAGTERSITGHYDNGLEFKVNTNTMSYNTSGALTVPSTITSNSGMVEAGSSSPIQLQKSGTHGYINMPDSGNMYFRIGSGFANSMTIKSNEKVGIGTSNPNAHLHVKADTGGSDSIMRIRNENTTSRTTTLQLEDYSGALADGVLKFVFPNAGSTSGSYLGLLYNSSGLYVAPGGNVGIGDTSPIGKLTVKAAADTIRAESLATDAKNITMSYHDSNDQGQIFCGEDGVVDKNIVLRGHTLIFQRNGGTEAARIDSSGDLNMVNSGQSSINYTTDGSLDYARIQGGKYGSGVGDLRFFTYSGGLSEAMRINRLGYVGIGGSFDPAGTLHLRSTAASTGPNLIFENTNNAQAMNIDYYNNSGSVQSRIRYSEGPGSFEIMPNSSANAAMILLYNGNVGVGTTNPFTKLQVVDTGWSSGAPYGSIVHIDGGSNHDNNWGHLHVNQSGTSANIGGRIRLGTAANNSYGGNPIAGITALNKDTSNGTYGNLEFSTRPSGGTNQMRMEISHNGHIKLSGDHGIRVFTGYFNAGTVTTSFDVNGYGAGVMMMTAAFNHYGFIQSYGCYKRAICSNGPGHGGTAIEVNDVDTAITSSNGGSWTFHRQSGTQASYRITKNAGTYAGGGYYWVRFEGNMGV